jgi:hypothetical protein
MTDLKKEIEKTVEGMIPEISHKAISLYKWILAISLILSSTPLISYLILK